MTIIKSEHIEVAPCEAEHFDKTAQILNNISLYTGDPLLSERAEKLYKDIEDFTKDYLHINYSLVEESD